MDNKKAIDLLNLIKFENAECNLGTWYHGIDGDMKEALEMAIKALKQKTCEDTISRRAVKEQMIKYGFHAPDMTVIEFIETLPSVNPHANNEDIHREREQAYMKGYEDASKRCRAEPCEDAISRQDAIRVASGYCHWSNIPKELAKLPSVNPIPCEDAINRQAVLDAMCDASVPIVYKGKPTFVVDYVGVIADIPSVNSEKPNRCADAISRQAAIDAMREETCGCCWDAKDILKHLPSVSTEKTGRWEWVQYDSNPNIGNWHCSECRNIVIQGVEKKGIHKEVIYKFCPWCGAKMEVEE